MSKKIDRDSLKDDLRQGKDFDVLALKYETSKDYIKKVYYEMKKAGERLPNRKSKEWRAISYMNKFDMVEIWLKLFNRE
jgi:hypothetical protein